MAWTRAVSANNAANVMVVDTISSDIFLRDQTTTISTALLRTTDSTGPALVAFAECMAAVSLSDRLCSNGRSLQRRQEPFTGFHPLQSARRPSRGGRTVQPLASPREYVIRRSALIRTITLR